MDREQALSLVKEKVKTNNLVKHMLATEACMKKLAVYFSEDVGKWGISGLLHDVDYDETKDDFDKHGIVSAELLQDMGVSEDIVNAIKAHSGKKDIENKLEQAIYSVDPLTGLIVAAALMHPSRKINDIDVQFVMNRFKEKRFAAGADRNQIMTCEKLGISLEEFAGMCLEAMQGIGKELGL
ncbi:HDIG domain-containing metalloprotein [Elusimicrobiota bacterium]